MYGFIYIGIKISEIERAMYLMKIPAEKQLGIARDVSYMAGKAAKEMNA